jgi:hypothetical protein
MCWSAMCGSAAASRTWACRCASHAPEPDAKTADFPAIRFFSVVGNPAYRHTDLVGGKWSVLSPETADWVSAVGFYFARKVEQETHVPLGLVVDSVGGTPAEAWTSAEALRPLHDFDIPLAEVERLAASDAPQYGNFVMHWYDEYDIGIKGKWGSPELDDSDWKTVTIPGGFRRVGRTHRARAGLVPQRSRAARSAAGRKDDALPRLHRANGHGLTSTGKRSAAVPGWRIRASTS